MLRKGIRDIRLLRSENPDVQAQLLDLDHYRPVSVMPEVRHDLSLVLGSGAEADVELLGDRARTALGADAEVLAALEIRAVTPASELPPAAVERLRWPGSVPGGGPGRVAGGWPAGQESAATGNGGKLEACPSLSPAPCAAGPTSSAPGLSDALPGRSGELPAAWRRAPPSSWPRQHAHLPVP